MENLTGPDVKAALAALDQRLSRIEQALDIGQPQKSDSATGPTEPAPIKTASFEPGPAAEPLIPPRRQPLRPAEQPAPAGDAGTSGRFLGLVGVIFFILSAAFFIKLAVNSGWLTPPALSASSSKCRPPSTRPSTGRQILTVR